MNKLIENNKVTISGEIVSDFIYSHEVFGEKFYVLYVKIPRESGNSDFIPIMISERLIEPTEDCKGCHILVNGQFRSYNHHEESKSRLVLSVFARELEFVDEEVENAKTNQIFWMVISAKHLFTGKLLLAERSRIFFWQ